MNINEYISHLLNNLPSDWLNLTTHRIDKFNEPRAKFEFIEEFEKLGKASREEFCELPTAFDYIRLGHPLSCVLEWAVAKKNDLDTKSVISFASHTMPIMAILRYNKFKKVKTRIVLSGDVLNQLNSDILSRVYEYDVKIENSNSSGEISYFDGDTIFVTTQLDLGLSELSEHIHYLLKVDAHLGSIIQVLKDFPDDVIKEIQHVRRRESIAMTPQNCLAELNEMIGRKADSSNLGVEQSTLNETIKDITSTRSNPLISSCGLTAQYAIMMGLVDFTKENFSQKPIHFIVPPNCYGGTNDQARRVAACIESVEIIDLAVDSGKDMVSELEKILDQSAAIDAVPYIIAEIPTNPRVEVPDLISLNKTLKEKRTNKNGEEATPPVFILDQTFCPNYKFLGEGDPLFDIQTIAYVSRSKFPSGGLCTAGYIVFNDLASKYESKIKEHLYLCDNQATTFQVKTLTQQMPSMNERIKAAYDNTRDFVEHIESVLPESKINFVSNEISSSGFTPSVFSLDLPTKGNTVEEKEAFKREMNLKLIAMMVANIPGEAKHCVSYGQLKGCYFTVPATSTQGTTKEGDKDYIVRISCSADMEMNKFKKTFSKFCHEVYGK